MAAFREGVRRVPKFAMAHSNLGRALELLKRPDEARASYEAALAADPDCVDAHKGLGILLARQNKLDEAAEHLRAAIRIHPKYVDAYIGLAITLDMQGKLVSHRGLRSGPPDRAGEPAGAQGSPAVSREASRRGAAPTRTVSATAARHFQAALTTSDRRTHAATPTPV